MTECSVIGDVVSNDATPCGKRGELEETWVPSREKLGYLSGLLSISLLMVLIMYHISIKKTNSKVI